MDALWKLLTRNSKDEVRKIASDEDMLTGYYQKLNRLSHNKEYCRMVWDERIEKNLRAQEAYYGGKQDGLAEGKELGIVEGKELGVAEGKKEMIMSMYNNGLSLEIISKVTSLSIDEISNIINTNNE